MPENRIIPVKLRNKILQITVLLSPIQHSARVALHCNVLYSTELQCSLKNSYKKRV